jgi:hypothetical protein
LFIADGNGCAELDEDDDSGGNGDRNYSVENDADWAVAGVRLERMGVSDLYNGQQGQQDEAKSRRHNHTWFGREGLATVWLEAGQN